MKCNLKLSGNALILTLSLSASSIEFYDDFLAIINISDQNKKVTGNVIEELQILCKTNPTQGNSQEELFLWSHKTLSSVYCSIKRKIKENINLKEASINDTV